MVLVHRLKQAQFAHLTNSALSNCLTIVSITVIHRHPWQDLSLSFIKEYIHILDKVKRPFTEIGVIPRFVMPRALARGVKTVGVDVGKRVGPVYGEYGDYRYLRISPPPPR
jgi:hypothetical protein